VVSRAAEPKIDNEDARVLVVTSAPGVKGALHDHKMNRVMIYLDAGKIELVSADGKKETQNFKAGEVLWSKATGMHTSENLSGHPVRIVEIELKSKPGAAAKVKMPELDPVKVDRKRYHVEFENDQVRVVRARYGPHDKGVMHEHVLNRVVTFITEGNMKVTTPEGEVKMVKASPGDVITGGAAKHIEENLNDTPFEVVVVEFKK
jgi:quercetin dioxygenase-like cupin family protein